jgi:hypothetical protein
MSEATEGILIFAALVLVCAIVSHRFLSNLALACLVASVSAAMVFQVLAYLHSGYLDALFLVAIGFSVLYGFAGAFLVGHLMRRLGLAARKRDAT